MYTRLNACIFVCHVQAKVMRANLPLQAVLNVELLKEVHHIGVGAKEDMKARLDPVAIFVLPGGNLSA